MSSLRIISAVAMLGMLSACSALQAPGVPQRAVASTSAQPNVNGPIQLARVTVDWQDVSILKQPQSEAKRLSGLLYQRLDKRALINQVATDVLRVTVLEMYLRSGSRTGVSTDYMTGEIELLDNTGNSKQVFRIKANYTQRGGEPVGAEARLDKLYAKFADLTVRELTHNQQNQTSGGIATAL